MVETEFAAESIVSLVSFHFGVSMVPVGSFRCVNGSGDFVLVFRVLLVHSPSVCFSVPKVLRCQSNK